MMIRGRSRLARRLVPVALCVTVVVGLMAAGLPLALAAPATPSFGSAIDAYAAYDGQRTCDPTAKPGVIDVRDLPERHVRDAQHLHRSDVRLHCQRAL